MRGLGCSMCAIGENEERMLTLRYVENLNEDREKELQGFGVWEAHVGNINFGSLEETELSRE